MLERSMLLFVVFLAAAGLVRRAERPEPVPERASFATFPMQLGDWTGVPDRPLDPKIVEILGVDDYLARTYFLPDHNGAGLYIGYYGSQRQGDTMHSPQNCLPGSGWEPISNRQFAINVPGPGSTGSDTAIRVNRYVVQKGLDKELVLYWYQSHGRVVASEYWGKFYLIRDAVRLNRTDGALVRVVTPIASPIHGGTESTAEDIATRFVRVLFPKLSTYLPS